MDYTILLRSKDATGGTNNNNRSYVYDVSDVLEALLGQKTFLDLQSSKTDDPNKKNVTYLIRS